MSGRRQRIFSCHGVALTELVLVLPVLMMLMVIAADVAHAIHTYNMLDAISREGIRPFTETREHRTGLQACAAAGGVLKDPLECRVIERVSRLLEHSGIPADRTSIIARIYIRWARVSGGRHRYFVDLMRLQLRHQPDFVLNRLAAALNIPLPLVLHVQTVGFGRAYDWQTLLDELRRRWRERMRS